MPYPKKNPETALYKKGRRQLNWIFSSYISPDVFWGKRKKYTKKEVMISVWEY